MTDKDFNKNMQKMFFRLQKNLGLVRKIKTESIVDWEEQNGD